MMPATEAPTRAKLIRRPLDAVIAWHDFRPITVADLLADVQALSRRLPDQARFVNACANRYAFLVGFLASAARGGTCLLPGAQSTAQLAAIRDRHPDSHVLTDQPDIDFGPKSIAVPILTGGSGGDQPADIDTDLIACIAFTSGSTGQPVAHAKAWGAIMEQTDAVARRFGLQDAETTAIVATVPHSHMYGFETTILLPLRANVAIHSGTPLYPDDVWQALARLPTPRLLVTSPVHLRALSSSHKSLPPIRAVISATAPLGAELAAQIEAQLGAELLEIYGCTEAGSVASRRTVTDTLWTPFDGLRVETVDEDGTPSARVHGPGVVRPIPLNDLIAVEPDRRFRLLGRREDLIKVGGKRGSLAGLTAILLGIEGVVDGTFVMPEPGDGGDATRPFVIVSAPGLAPKAILDALRLHIDPAFVPRRVIMTDNLPRNPLGKLPKARITELVAAYADPEAG